jgi:putative NADH-flavin reductase
MRLMKITIFGSTGQVGQHLVRRALERDWTVVAFARSPSKLGNLRGRVTVVKGTVQDADAVDRAVQGAGAVLSAVGHTDSSAGNVLTVTADHLMESMQRHGVDRLVTLVGAGVEADGDPSSFGRTVMRTVMGWVAREMLDDAQRHADVVRASDLDWVVVRPPRLTNEPATGQWRAGYLKLGPMATLTREDLAEFMLQQVETDDWVGESPMVVN